MKIAIAVIVLAAALGALNLWTSGAANGWISAGVLLGAGLGAGVIAWIVGILLRNRQRRRLKDTRDSALW